MKGLIERVPVYITKGNHEGHNGLYERLLLPPGEKGDFGFDYGPLHYCGIDNVSKRADESRLVAGIARDAQASDAPWKFVSYHVPNVNFGAHWSNWRQGEALPAFAEAGIDFVITGHSHQYERFHPVAAPGTRAVRYVHHRRRRGGSARPDRADCLPCVCEVHLSVLPLSHPRQYADHGHHRRGRTRHRPHRDHERGRADWMESTRSRPCRWAVFSFTVCCTKPEGGLEG